MAQDAYSCTYKATVGIKGLIKYSYRVNSRRLNLKCWCTSA